MIRIVNWKGTYRVRSNVNVLLLAVLDQVVALQHGVALDLVDGGNDTGAINEGLKLFKSFVSTDLRCPLHVEALLTCSMVWFETPTERALLLGSLVMAIDRERVNTLIFQVMHEPAYPSRCQRWKHRHQ